MIQRYALLLLILVICLPTWGQTRYSNPQDHDSSRSSPVTAQLVETRIDELNITTALPENTKTQLLELYRQTLSNLQEIRSKTDRADSFADDIDTLPEQTRIIREHLDSITQTDSRVILDVDLDTPLADIEQQLRTELAKQVATDARRTDFEQRLSYHQDRPAIISQRLTEMQEQQENVMEPPSSSLDAQTIPMLREAQRWAQETLAMALSSEIRMLEQELLSHPMRVALLKARRDQELAQLASIDARVQALGELVNHKRQLEAEQARAAAEAIHQETADLNPLLAKLARDNADVTEELNTMASRLGALDREQRHAERLAARIEADYRDARSTLEAGGLARGLGRVLLEHRASLPDLQVYAHRQRLRREQIAGTMVRRLSHREEARRLADTTEAVTQLETEIGTALTPTLQTHLRELVAQRQALLTKALETEEFYLREIHELDAAEAQMLEVATAYDAFLDQHLLWLRSAEPTGLEDLRGLPVEIRKLLAAETRGPLGSIIIQQTQYSLLFWLSLLASTVLLWQRRNLKAAIQQTGRWVGKPNTDRFFHTFKALLLTLIAAAPLPLILATAGWQLMVATQGTELSHGLGYSLLRAASYFYALEILRLLCIPAGLALAHFRWSDVGVQLLRRQVRRLTWIFVPGILLIRLVVDLNPGETGGTVARLLFLLSYSALALVIYQIFHPGRGVLAQQRSAHKGGLLQRSHRLWFPPLVGFPIGLILLAFSGYIYSVVVLSYAIIFSLWLVVALILLHALALRWLLIIRRRLLYQAALERRRVALAARQSSEADEEGSLWQVEEPEVDLAALSDGTQGLLNLLIIFSGVMALYLIWSPVLPALGILDGITLWHYTAVVDGENQPLPLTLADLLLALLYLFVIGILMRHLPALLEIILLRRFGMSSGNRYAVIALSNYALVLTGGLLVFSTLGAQWSQLQWLVAALGVGIGFGLQEIIANFISGLIIMFERPIRIGDIITVGNTDGVVTRIRIRATTIRNWDYKELLIPNKEFITGRLLNWSLSDPITRIVIPLRVTHDTDVEQALTIMREAAEQHPHVVDDPAPLLTFDSFEDNRLSLVLRAYIDTIDYRMLTLTELNKTIHQRFREAGIAIALPPQEVYLHTRDTIRLDLPGTDHQPLGDQP